MFRHRVLAALALFLFAAPSLAWNAGGHRVAARIAWLALAPAEQSALWEILRAHPDFPHWRSPRRQTMEAALLAGDRSTLFAEAANWADAIRDADDHAEEQPDVPVGSANLPDRLRHRDWHFVNQPLAEPSETMLAGQLHDAIPRLSRMMAGQQPGNRAFALVWLLHLVADLHQPLHVATRRLDRSRHDAGGNLVAVRLDPSLISKHQRGRQISLHAYWDDLVAPPWLQGGQLDRLVGRLMAEQAPPPTAGQVADWRRQSHRLAGEAYRSLVGNGRVAAIDIAAHQAIRRIAERQIALAGYRLADLLRRSLSGEAGSAEDGSGFQRGSGQELSARQAATARPLQ